MNIRMVILALIALLCMPIVVWGQEVEEEPGWGAETSAFMRGQRDQKAVWRESSDTDRDAKGHPTKQAKDDLKERRKTEKRVFFESRKNVGDGEPDPGTIFLD